METINVLYTVTTFSEFFSKTKDLFCFLPHAKIQALLRKENTQNHHLHVAWFALIPSIILIDCKALSLSLS